MKQKSFDEKMGNMEEEMDMLRKDNANLSSQLQ